jgi:hypothetical protein
MRFLAAMTAALLFAATPVAAQSIEDVNAMIETVLGDHSKYQAAFEALQAAVAADDREAVIALAFYPFVAKMPDRLMIETPEDFAASYDAIMTDEIVGAIEAQAYETLIVNDQGIGFGNGQVWLAGVCEEETCDAWDVKIITIQTTAP